MSLNRDMPSGWSIVSGESAAVGKNSIDDAAAFLKGIHENLAYGFMCDVQRYGIQPQATHFFSSIIDWFKRAGLQEGRPQVQRIDDIQHTLDVRNVHLQADLPHPLQVQLSRYTTKKGKAGYMFVVYELQTKGEEFVRGEAISFRGLEEASSNEWIDVPVPVDYEKRIIQLSQRAKSVEHYFATVIPSRWSSPGGGMPARLAA